MAAWALIRSSSFDAACLPPLYHPVSLGPSSPGGRLSAACLVRGDPANPSARLRAQPMTAAPYSHASLSPQVDGYLRRMPGVVREAVDDTAGAAKTIAEQQLK